MVRRITNSIRRSVLASLRIQGEARTAGQAEYGENKRCPECTTCLEAERREGSAS